MEFVETINYGDIPYNRLNDIINENLFYGENIIVRELFKGDISDLEYDYYEVVSFNDIEIAFERTDDIDFPYSMYFRHYIARKEWTHLDDISQNLFDNRRN